MLFVSWTFEAMACGVEMVLPDGCRDIIVRRCGDGGAEVFETDLDLAPREVPVSGGARMTGFRLRPGVSLSRDGQAALSRDDGFRVEDLPAMVVHDPELAELIEALSCSEAGLRGVARQAGVSERRLQRRLHRAGQPSPAFWLLLGRARRAAIALHTDAPLAAIAADHGYADQAHMTREFRRWFGATPDRIRRRRALLDQLAQPGLATWTGEQISTRYPSGSLT